MRETSHPGVFACGNVLQVHDLVDFVTGESQTAGDGAADFILNKRGENAKYINTRAINGARYVIPQRLNKNGEGDVKLYFRVGEVYRNAKIVITQGDKVIYSKRKPKLAPGEMENVVLKEDVIKSLSDDDLVVQIEAKEEKS